MWIVAFDTYALLAEITDQLKYAQAMAYKAVVVQVRALCVALLLVRYTCVGADCCQIMVLSAAEKRTPFLGVLYDELFRQSIEDLSGKLGSGSVCVAGLCIAN